MDNVKLQISCFKPVLPGGKAPGAFCCLIIIYHQVLSSTKIPIIRLSPNPKRVLLVMEIKYVLQRPTDVTDVVQMLQMVKERCAAQV